MSLTLDVWLEGEAVNEWLFGVWLFWPLLKGKLFQGEHRGSVSGENEKYDLNDTFSPNPMRFAAIFAWLFTFHPFVLLILSIRLSFRWTPGPETMFYITHICCNYTNIRMWHQMFEFPGFVLSDCVAGESLLPHEDSSFLWVQRRDQRMWALCTRDLLDKPRQRKVIPHLFLCCDPPSVPQETPDKQWCATRQFPGTQMFF